VVDSVEHQGSLLQSGRVHVREVSACRGPPAHVGFKVSVAQSLKGEGPGLEQLDICWSVFRSYAELHERLKETTAKDVFFPSLPSPSEADSTVTKHISFLSLSFSFSLL